MRKVLLSELSDAVRGFLSDAMREDGLIVEDDWGCPKASLLPLQSTAETKPGHQPELPAWPGTVLSPLHRDELYAEI